MNNKQKKRHTNKRFSHIKSSIADIVSPLQHDNGALSEIKLLWHAIGEDVDKNSKPVSIKNKILIVNVSSSPWMQQLQFIKYDIIEFINCNFGKKVILDIRFKIG